MSVWTVICKPGRGRRQAGLSARTKAANCRLGTENQQLRGDLDGAQQLIAGLTLKLEEEQQWNDTELERLTELLHDEQAAHAQTRQKLDQAVRSNASNANAETVQTDASVLHAAPADAFVDAPPPAPEYAPHSRLLSSRSIVLTLPEALGAKS